MLASGVCLHQMHDNDDHDIVNCHVEECDIMTEFRRWKPGVSSRYRSDALKLNRKYSMHSCNDSAIFFVN